jgi:hypothetical protein
MLSWWVGSEGLPVLFVPSAPTSILPVAELPSAKKAVTPVSSSSYRWRRFPYSMLRLWQSQSRSLARSTRRR